MMMGSPMRWLALLLVSGCIPDFALESRTFEIAEAGVQDALPMGEDALPHDAGSEASDVPAFDTGPEPEDVGFEETGVTDTGTVTEDRDAGFEEDASDAGIDCEISGCADERCRDYVSANWACAQDGTKRETNCANDVSDDDDGAADCADPDCADFPGTGWVCGGDGQRHETSCANGTNDDGDADTDCVDPDCDGVSDPAEGWECGADDQLHETDCADLDDNDGDADSDCADSDCSTFMTAGWQCRNGVRAETVCDNLIDDDSDNLPDCNDPDCPGCLLGLPICCPNGSCAALVCLL
jgi:hypothetical protein